MKEKSPESMDQLCEMFSDMSGINLVVAVTAALGAALSVKVAKHIYAKQKLKQKIDARVQFVRQKERQLEQKLGSLEPESKGLWDNIVHLSVKDLQSGLKSGKIQAIDTLRAYQWSALKVNGQINCVVEFIDEAEKWAQDCDLTPLEKRGPLHGMPISVKDNFKVKGYCITSGLTQCLDMKCADDSLTVTLVKEMGAVPFCITNVPQSCLTMQCSNPIYGATGNPYSHDHDCGGSSGGEGALIGGGGSILGLGNDIGGSLRCPASYCGIYSLKPTTGRHISNRGLRDRMPPNLYIKVSSGFMSASVDGLVHGFQSIWNNDKLYLNDKSIAPLKWRGEIFDSKKKLKIGYFLNDGFYQSHPGYHRAIFKAKQLLEGSGHEVVEFSPPPINQVNEFFSGFIYTDNFVHLSQVLDNDLILDSSVSGVRMYARLLQYLPNWILSKLFNGILSIFTVLRVFPAFNSIPLLMKKAKDCDDLIQEYTDKMNNSGIDLILAPGAMLPAPKKGFLGALPSASTAFATWNTFNFPAGVVPITNVTAEDQALMHKLLPAKDFVYKKIKQACEGCEGVPLSVQVIGRRYDEENVLRLMAELERLSGYTQFKDR